MFHKPRDDPYATMTVYSTFDTLKRRFVPRKDMLNG